MSEKAEQLENVNPAPTSNVDADVTHPKTNGSDPKKAKSNNDACPLRPLKYKVVDEEGSATGDRVTSTSDRLIAWSAVATAAFTFALAIVSGYQLHEIRTGSRDTHDLALAAEAQAESTHDLALAAKAQAEASKAQVAEMQTSLTKQDDLILQATQQAKSTNQLAREASRSADAAQEAIALDKAADRPWLGFELSGPEPKEGEKLSVHAVLTNAGKTPARLISITTGGVLDYHFPENPVFSIKPEEQGSRGIIVPGATFDASHDFPDKVVLSNRTQFNMQRGENWYLFGEATYQGVNENQIHHTRACITWSRADKRWINCHEFNDAN